MIIIAVWKDVSRAMASIPMELPDENLLEPEKPARVTLNGENLNDLEMYYLTYHPENQDVRLVLVKKTKRIENSC